MPVVTVVGPDEVNPQIAQVLRNDQTITWQLSPNLAWNPNAGDCAVKFMEETEVYSEWPGTPPAPVGLLTPGEPDRREYTATANRLMAPREFRAYHYEIAVVDSNTGNPVMVRLRRAGEWYDPEVVNEPRP
jgi:hypothetical protein